MTLNEDKKKLLIESIRQGDHDAFREIYNHYFPAVYSFSYKFLKSKDVAQECTQLTFIKIWARREQLNSDLNFKSYLFTICKNSILKTIENAARENRFKDMVMNDHSNTDEVTDSSEQLEKVALEAIEQLPAQRQLIFKLCKLEGQSYHEVATSLGISSGTVRDHMFKASKSIKKFLSLHKIIGYLILGTGYWVLN